MKKFLSYSLCAASLLLSCAPDSPLKIDTSGAKDLTNTFLTNRSVNCKDYMNTYTSKAKDVKRNQEFSGQLQITVSGDKCIFTTNAIPNHDVNDGKTGFVNPLAEQDDRFEVTTSPKIADSNTTLSLQTDNAIMLNGVKVDLLAAACFGVGDGKIGCNNMSSPWRYDPMHANNDFGTDTHNAHTQPDGTYHYHGKPNALFKDDASSESPVVGFAADGFPIYGSYINDEGTIRKVKSSFKLKSGERPSDESSPGGTYDGTYRDDYEYVKGTGDLDECNGMTVNGNYGYYVTDEFPYMMACFKGTPDASFDKGPPNGGPPPGR